MAKLFGIFEQTFHKFIEDIVMIKYNTISNAGYAEGYYSVGLALRMKCTKVLSFDIYIEVLKACRYLAKSNLILERLMFLGTLNEN